MKAVILAGGLGTRLSEETVIKPKPMVEIGTRPIIWHIMKIYSHYGINDFVICLGYKGYMLKEYFFNYSLHTSDVTFDLKNNSITHHKKETEPWKISLIDTGEESMTGGRIKRIKDYIGNEDFCVTYGDGVADVNVSNLVKFHKEHGKLATVTAVQPPGRFGALGIKNNQVYAFQEKPQGGGWINGGFFVFSPKVFDYIAGDSTVLEREPLESLSKAGQLMSFFHEGFWQPMDTLREKKQLDEMWTKNQAPWKVW